MTTLLFLRLSSRFGYIFASASGVQGRAGFRQVSHQIRVQFLWIVIFLLNLPPNLGQLFLKHLALLAFYQNITYT